MPNEDITQLGFTAQCRLLLPSGINDQQTLREREFCESLYILILLIPRSI